MKNIVNIGIIGGGWIAEHAHIPALMEKENVRISAIFDENCERAGMLCKEYSIPCAFHEIEKFLECDLDGVIIATPNDTHYTYTMKVLNKGIGVLCEKPVALKTREVNDIMRLAKEKNTVYVPGFVNRWRQDIQMAYQEIRKGTIGSINRIEAGWLRKSGVPRPGTWFTLRKHAGGGVLTDLGSHIMDLCLLFLGDAKPIDYQLTTAMCNSEALKETGAASWFEKEEGISFDIDVEESAIADVAFADNISLQVNLSWRAPVEADCTYFRMIGSKGSITIQTLFGFSNDRLWKEDSLTIHSDREEIILQLDPEKNHSRNAFREMLSYYVDALLGGEMDFTNCKDAFKTVSLIEKLYAHERINEDKVSRRLLEGI